MCSLRRRQRRSHLSQRRHLHEGHRQRCLPHRELRHRHRRDHRAGTDGRDHHRDRLCAHGHGLRRRIAVAGRRGWFPVVGRPPRSWCPEGDRGLRRPRPGSIGWISTIGRRTWAKVTTYRDDGRDAVTRLVAFDASGKELLRVPPEQVGDSALSVPVASCGHSGSVGIAMGPSDCGESTLPPATRSSRPLRSPVKPCSTEGGVTGGCSRSQHLRARPHPRVGAGRVLNRITP